MVRFAFHTATFVLNVHNYEAQARYCVGYFASLKTTRLIPFLGFVFQHAWLTFYGISELRHYQYIPVVCDTAERYH